MAVIIGTLHIHGNLKNEKGITLIALVITIIVLLILVGISIATLTGQNGLLKSAQEARDKYIISQENEEKDLEELQKKLEIKDNLPENTEENPQDIGKEVALKDGWGEEIVSYINTEDGKKVEELTKVATVYAISVGKGQTVPVPKGFYYVGGTLDNGVIISDNSDDRYGYNPETKRENDRNLDKTTHEYALNLRGNQFVWIPCTIDSYVKTTTFPKSNNFDTSTYSSEKTQIEKYGGFYIGRYEAGTSNIQGINFAEISTSGPKTDETNYTKVTSGNVTSKANEIPYYHSDYYTALKMSERMYEDSKYVNSGLVTGTMWDVMLNVMNKKTGCDLFSSDWGNFVDLSWNNLRGFHCDVGSRGEHGSWKINDVSYKKEADSSVIFSTGANNNFQKMHLYDVAGNMWEWTQEMTCISTEACTIRSSGFANSYNRHPVSYRDDYGKNDAHYDVSFRVALYMK